jgi:DNA-binding XRE family transcriptional regulator
VPFYAASMNDRAENEPEDDEAERMVLAEDEALRTRLRMKVRELRCAAKLTLRAAAEKSEVHWRHWQKIEAGEVNVTMQTMVRIARALQVDVPELFAECSPDKSDAPLP